MPDDRVKVVETEAPANDADIGVEWDYGMPPDILAAGEANVANDADESAPGDEDAEDLSPNLLQLLDKLLVVGDVARLPVTVSWSRRGGEYIRGETSFQIPLCQGR